MKTAKFNIKHDTQRNQEWFNISQLMLLKFQGALVVQLLLLLLLKGK